MFWKKLKHTDSELGEFTYSSGSWGVNVDTRYGQVLASVDGDRNSLDAAALLQLREVLLDLDKHYSSALDAIRLDESAQSFLDGANGVLEFGNICSSKVPGDFSLMFGLTDWKDATISVEFEQGSVREVWCGD
jgi:hypothetical protein